MTKKQEALVKAKELLPKGYKLLYLTEFGSRLYGTHTEESDHDFYGIFLPSIKDLALNKIKKHFRFSTGSNSEKNSKEDIDIQLMSLQYWLLSLVKKGDTVGLDLFFSHTNKEAVIYQDQIMDLLFMSPELLINSEEVVNSSYVRYAMSQARRYGIKGTKLNILMNLEKWLNEVDKTQVLNLEKDSLETIVDSILKRFEDDQYLTTKELDNNIKAIQLCGKYYPYHIKIGYFIKCVKDVVNNYGKRAKQAQQNEGIDWKAISHALRAIYQAQMLSSEGVITFPFKDSVREALLDIKQGKKDWSEVSKEIEKGIEKVDNLTPEWYGNWCDSFVNLIIWSCYSL